VAFTTVPDRAVGYAPLEADWDTYIKDNMNSGTWVQLANSTLAAPAASFDFTSISGSFAHLLVEMYLRGDDTTTAVAASLRFNADTGNNYDDQRLSASAAVAAAAENFAGSSPDFAFAPAANATSNVFGAARLLIPHYANASNNKAALSRWATKTATTTGTLQAGAAAVFWRSNAAITRVTIFPGTGDWDTGSRATLYALA
jgi:hypothetical protein